MMVGISLIEMLIALLVLSFGLLGMAGLQAYSLRNNTNAYYRSQATVLAYEIVDRMRANRVAAVGAEPGRRNSSFASTYNISLGDIPPTGTTIAQRDLREWKLALRGNSTTQGRLPSGDGAVACSGLTAICTITVRWDDSRGAAAPAQFVYSTEL